MGLERRAFLQKASLALGALGVGGSTLLCGPNQYAQALGKPTRRKLALLIGINQYPERALDSIPAQDVLLRGCLTDVEMQRQVLLHRFGFQPADILTLTNQAATRAGILTAIDQHLVQQAQADDVVLLHFSGYGSQVYLDRDPSRSHLAWVTVDSHLPHEDQPALTDLLEAEIATVLRRLGTQNVTTVVDAGYQDTGYGRWGNLKVRSRPTAPTGSLAKGFVGNPDTLLGAAVPPWPGLLLRAGEPGNLVLEGQWDGFSAGMFTYALSQSLWASIPDPNPKIWVQRVGDHLQRWTGPDQTPALGSGLPTKALMAYALPPQMASAAGVVMPSGGEGRSGELWLGGIDPAVLRYLQPGSRLTTGPTASGPDQPVSPLDLRLESRTGLQGLARPVNPGEVWPKDGQPIYEKVRLLPQTIALIVALDTQLKRVERVDATSALAGLPFVAAITAGEKGADCLFGRLPLGPVTTLTAALPNTTASPPPPQPSRDRLSESSYGLFAPNRTLVPGTMLTKEEAVKTAITRLTPTLRSLLALKLIRLTQNRTASGLAVTVALEAVRPTAKVLLRQQTERSSPTSLLPAGQVDDTSTVDLSRDTRFLYRVTNRGDQPLYILVIRFDSQGDCSARVVFPDAALAEAPLTDLPPVLAPRQTQLIPNTPNGWGVLGAVTSVETHLTLSDRPFRHCLEVMAADGAINPLETDLRRVSQPLKLAQALLQDLHSDTALGDRTSPDSYALSHDRWVTFNVCYAINTV